MPDDAPRRAEDASDAAADADTDPARDATTQDDAPDANAPDRETREESTDPEASGFEDDPDPAASVKSAAPDVPEGPVDPGVPRDVRNYEKFQKIDGATYDRANEFLRDRTYITAREWAIARLCADFRTETGVEMTKIGENLPHLVPFMTDTYSPQAVNQARASFEEKITTAGATFLYGAMCDFFTAEELDDLMYEVTEVAKFLLEVEGVELTVEEELEAEDRISSVMREVRESSAALRHDRVECPECGHEIDTGDPEHGHDEPVEADD